jgi:hypothetical protein
MNTPKQMSAKCWVRLLPIRIAAILIGGWANQATSHGDATNTNSTPLKYEEPKLLTGTIYAKDSGRQQVLFKFKRVATRSGSRMNVLREYTYPDGKPAARERVVYDGEDLLSYALDELQNGAAGTVKVRRDPGNPAKSALLFEYAKDLASGSKPKTSTEALRNDTLNGDMVAPFLVSHWGELSKGEKVRCRFLVVPRRETVGFTFVKEAETTLGGRRVVIIRMEATSLIIARLVDPVFFTVEKDGQHRVLQYVGRVTPKTKAGNKWDDLDATVVFEWPSP